MTQPLLPGASARRVAAPATEVDPDHELVERWRGGDASAFETLVRRHERRVYGLLVRLLGDRTDAEDVLQETFLNLHRHGHRFRSEARFSTFVYRVAVNAALNRRRSLGRARTREQGLAQRQAVGDELPQTPSDPESTAHGTRVRQRVHEALECLKPSLRLPLTLFDLEGMPYGEIARVLSLPEGTVKSRIHRARRALREQLRDLVDA